MSNVSELIAKLEKLPWDANINIIIHDRVHDRELQVDLESVDLNAYFDKNSHLVQVVNLSGAYRR